MTKNLNSTNKDVKKILKKYNFKNNSILIGLAALVISCGGGGGGVGTSIKPTPTPNTPSDSTPAIGWNDSTVSYNKNNPSNKPDTTLTGSGVNIGIIDIAFENPAFASDLTEKFGTRLEKLTVPDFTPTYLPDEDHGIAVAALAAGSTEGIAKEAKVYIVDAAKKGPDPKDSSKEKTHPEVSLDMYRALKNKGVTIYNQSFGSDTLQESDTATYADKMGRAAVRFYEEEVNNGSLFVWAAGNVSTDKQPTLEGGLPYFNSSLEKGWINVVGLTAKEGAESGNRNWNNLKALSPAGVAKNWTVTVLGDQHYKLKTQYYIGSGSSFAAPIVTGTAALIKQKYPWMDGSLIRQTILSTATDIGERGVDEIYGWGLLNIDKALKGPALFSKQLALSDNVVINIPSGTYTFSNNISGDAGLVLRGSGTLILNGAATYTGETNVGNNVYLKIKRMNSPSTLSIGKEAIVEVSSSTINNIQNDGTFINNGNSIANNVVMTNESKMYSDINANLKATNAEVNGIVTVTNNNGEYLTKNGKNIDIITGNVTGNSEIKSNNGLMTVNKIKTENLSANISRTDTIEYAKSLNSDTEQLNTARQIETALENVDKNYESGKKEAGILGSKLQTLNLNTLDSMSGQIYASAQALTFEQSETVNKNLSNRISMLSKSMENSDKKFGFWTSGIFSKGNIKKDGFAKGNTSVKGGQIGFDMKISPDAILGISADYSKGKVKFNRYNGQSKADMTGLSLYGRQNLGNSYIAGRAGIGFADSRVERDIIVNNNYIEHSKVSHNDNIISGYFETGYDIKNKEGDFAVTPYAALGMDKVTRGKFSEENTNFGMKADKKSYNMPYASIGIKTVKTFGKTDITGYAGYTQGLNKQNMDFDASYNFAPDAKFKVKGINYSRNKINAGIGVNTEIKNGASWYANYDYKHSTDKSKADNHMITTGIRFEF